MSFKSILLLDDDPQFHRLIVPVLKSRGHRVLQAHSGQEASSIVEREKLDLIIVDGQLPDCNGIEWIARSRAKDDRVGLIFVSAYWRDAQSYHKLTKELGVSLVLHKPIIPSVFAAEVDILFGHKSPSVEPAPVEDIEDTLLVLRSEYARELPLKLRELAHSLRQIRTQPDNFFLVGEARTLSHRLRGTAASYGFPQIGEKVGHVENRLAAIQNNSQVVNDGFWAEIDVAMDFLVGESEAVAGQVARQVSERVPGIPVPYSPAIARILVVDDDEAFLDLIEELGRAHLVQVIRATTAPEALEKACMSVLDAALIDVELESEEAAFKLAVDVRALPGYDSLPLAFISGGGHMENNVDVNRVGAVCLDRSLERGALEAALQQLIAIRQVARPRVLVVDDDNDFSRRIAFVLSYEGMVAITLDDTETILEVMQEFSPDLLLLDVMMPGVSGFDICRMLRAIPRWQDLPILFLTSHTDVESRVAAFQSGGDDYLAKPVVNEELLTRIKVRLERARLLQERIDKDPITGLLLRRSFMEQLAAMLSESQRQKWAVTVCLIDIDDFKGLAETYGHLASDGVLNALGDLLRRRFRAEDLRGRWGGEQFVLAFRAETMPDIKEMMERVLAEFIAVEFRGEFGQSFYASFSGGLSQFPEDGNTIHDLLKAADGRLLEAKSSGPKHFVMASPEKQKA